jgi:hypothetical protein
MTMSESAYRAERARQTQVLYDAVDKAVQGAAVHFEPPMLNAVIGALVANLAESIAAIGDHRTRKNMRQSVEKELSQRIAAVIADGRPNAKTIVVNGGMH